NPHGKSLATIEDLPPEILMEVLKHLNVSNLRDIQFTSHKVHKAIVLLLEPDRKVIATHYLQDPTILPTMKKNYRHLRTTDPVAAKAQISKYFNDHLQFRKDYDLLLFQRNSNLSQTLMMMLHSLRDDMFILCELYLQRARSMTPSDTEAKLPTLASLQYPDFYTNGPVTQTHDYPKILNELKESVNFNRFRSFADIHQGIWGDFNDGYMTEMPDLVERYLEIINNVDLLPVLTERQGKLVDKIWVENIALNNADRSRHFFNDIMAFQLIPKLIGAYIAKGYYDLAIVFIKTMMKNRYLTKFWQSIPADTGLNYPERAVYLALSTGHAKAIRLVKKMKNMPGFRANRLFQ
ncbi:hypothetical protein H4R34_006003, partial [Dimargaris verticillata]